MIIKLCGFTNVSDALFAVDRGATAIGFNFYPPSPRFVPPEKAAEICTAIEGKATRVGVFVGWPEQLYPFLDVMQVHGLDSTSRFPEKTAKTAVWIACGVDTAPLFAPRLVVIDTSWGRGILGNWKQIAKLNQPYILSGGLDASNIRQALEILHPAGVDVCSGIESEPGVKDRARIQAFLEALQALPGRP